jgi:endonuclease/exonuclease/phosphatase (EEP) superfamily protein YafD
MRFLRLALSVLLWLLALATLAASLLAQGGRFSAELDVLTHFAPVYLAVAALVGLLAPLSLGRGRWALIGIALTAAASDALLMAPEFLIERRAPQAAAPGQIKIIQFNAWGGNVSPDRAAAWILAQQPDVLVMEEGKRITDRLVAGGYRVACRGCGALIFTRQRASWSAGRDPRDPRTTFLAAARYHDAHGDFLVVGVHRAWPVRFARDQREAEGLRAYLRPLPKARMILAGDFNSTPWSFERRRDDLDFGLIRRTRGLPTWPAAKLSHNRLPAPFPYLPIDHVYAGPGWATVKVERGPALGSDHYPVVVTLAPVESSGT